MSPPVGVLIGTVVAPERSVALARQAESLGLGELWYSEHYFNSGGLTGAATVLAATEAIPVGLGVVSAVARPPAVLAMELATLARVHPGRVRAGIGAGEPTRLAEMGIAPASPLRATRGCVEEVRTLLAGGTVGSVGLGFPAGERVPIYLGASGPRMLRLSGAIADGTVLSLIKSPAYIRWAREQIKAGAAAAGRSGPHRIVSLAALAVDDDGDRARAAVRPFLAADLAGGPNVFTDAHGTSKELAAILDRGGPRLLERELPGWGDELAVAGDPSECALAIVRQLEAGADAVVVLPVPVERGDELLRVLAEEVVPRLSTPATSKGATVHAEG